MAWNLYHQFLLKQEDGNSIDLNTDVIKMGFLDSTYSPVQATDALWATISAGKEVSGTNYTAGGPTLVATCTLTAGTVTFDSADPAPFAQSGSGFSDARYAVAYASATGRLIAYHDFGTDKGNVSGPFTVQMDAAGIFSKA